jgi:hypothetical protein
MASISPDGKPSTRTKGTVTRVLAQDLLTRDDFHSPLFFKSSSGAIFKVYNPDVTDCRPPLRLGEPKWRLVVAPSYDGCPFHEIGAFVRTLTELTEWLLKFKSVKLGETYIDLIDV